jgi:dethiobiotin synthetase
MALRFLISGTNPGCGKTMAGCALAFAFKVRGMRVGVMKPVAIGSGEHDAAALQAASSSADDLELISPYRFHSAVSLYDGSGATPDRGRIQKIYREIAARSDVMVVEEAESIAAPIASGWNYADVAQDFGLEIVLLVANRPGFLGAAALVCDYAAVRRLPLRGFILNCLEASTSGSVEVNADTLRRALGVPCLGTVRFKEPLSLRIVERLL